jgi:hypothetical protein
LTETVFHELMHFLFLRHGQSLDAQKPGGSADKAIRELERQVRKEIRKAKREARRAARQAATGDRRQRGSDQKGGRSVGKRKAPKDAATYIRCESIGEMIRIVFERE